MTTLSKKIIILHIFILIILVFIDLISKYLFYDLKWGEYYAFIEPMMNLWISFSVSVSLSLVLIFSFIALLIFCIAYYKAAFPKIATVFFLAGTLGNTYDRVLFWWVRDFLVFPGWFVFNIADVLLFIWVLIVLIDLLIEQTNENI